MLVAGEIIVVGEDAGLYIARNAQHTVLLQTEQGFLITTSYLSSNPIKEVNLELWPSCLHVKVVDFFAKRLCVLVIFLKISWR